MERLERIDKVLLWIVFPLWVVCFSLGARSALHGQAICSVYLSAADGTDDYPIVSGFDILDDFGWRDFRKSGLQVGDRLIQLGDSDLRGVDDAEFFAQLAQEVGADRRVIVIFERGEKRKTTSLPVRLYKEFWPRLPVSLAFALTALVLLLRARPSPMVRACSQASLCMAFVFAYSFGGGRLEAYLRFSVEVVSLTLLGPLSLRFALLFPHGTSATKRQTRVFPWFFAAIGLLQAVRYVSRSFGLSFLAEAVRQANFVIVAALLVTFLAVVTRTYRNVDPIGRRQIRLCVFGLYCAFLPVIIGAALYSLDTRFHPIYTIGSIALAILPVSLLAAIARYNLFDIDRLISGTASYSLLVALLALGGEVLFEPLAARVASFVGFDPGSGQVAFVVLLAAALVPAQRAWRPYVDQLFFAEGRAVEARVEELLIEISRVFDVAAVMERTGQGIDRAFHPEFFVIYERVGECFEAAYLVGSAECPSIPADDQGVLMLDTKVTPIRLDSRGAAPTSAGQINSLVSGAAVILPLRCQGALDSFVAIGPKRSGDVYTSTDVSLLSTVAHAVSERLTSAAATGSMNQIESRR